MINIETWKRQELRKQALASLTNRVNNLRATSLEQRLTLKDGVVILTPEGDDWVGKQITFEDGTLLPPGEYVLAASRDSGEDILVIDKDGNIKEVRRASAMQRVSPQNFGVKPMNIGMHKPQNGFDKFLTHIFSRYE